MTTATPDEKQKLLIATQKVYVGIYVRERNGSSNAQIRAFEKLGNIGTLPNEEEATLAYAFAKMTQQKISCSLVLKVKK